MAVSKKVKDHLGNEYNSLSSMLNAYKINYSAFKYRLETLNMSLEDALTSPHKDMSSTAIECTDHKGNKFPSKVAMCDYWRIPRPVYFRRIRDGWTQERALTEPIKHIQAKKNQIEDHKGNKFDTIDEMCQHYDISKTQYMINIRNNCTLEEALTLHTEQTVCKDHLGNEYSSINEMCRAYKITKTVLRSRIELGWTLKEILTNPSKKLNYNKIKDHLGNEFDCIKDMCKHYNVSEVTYKYRKNLGLNTESSLQEGNIHNVQCTDHKGNKFGSIFEMCIYWNITTSTYYSRFKNRNWSIEDTLTKITPAKYTKFGPNLTIVKHIQKDYYEVEYCNELYVWHKDKIFDYYRENLLYPTIGFRVIKQIDNIYYEVKTKTGNCVMPYTEITKHLRKMLKCA